MCRISRLRSSYLILRNHSNVASLWCLYWTNPSITASSLQISNSTWLMSSSPSYSSFPIQIIILLLLYWWIPAICYPSTIGKDVGDVSRLSGICILYGIVDVWLCCETLLTGKSELSHIVRLGGILAKWLCLLVGARALRPRTCSGAWKSLWPRVFVLGYPTRPKDTAPPKLDSQLPWSACS